MSMYKLLTRVSCCRSRTAQRSWRQRWRTWRASWRTWQPSHSRSLSVSLEGKSCKRQLIRDMTRIETRPTNIASDSSWGYVNVYRQHLMLPRESSHLGFMQGSLVHVITPASAGSCCGVGGQTSADSSKSWSCYNWSAVNIRTRTNGSQDNRFCACESDFWRITYKVVRHSEALDCSHWTHFKCMCI